jgi:hypothetical protein
MQKEAEHEGKYWQIMVKVFRHFDPDGRGLTPRQVFKYTDAVRAATRSTVYNILSRFPCFQRGDDSKYRLDEEKIGRVKSPHRPKPMPQPSPQVPRAPTPAREQTVLKRVVPPGDRATGVISLTSELLPHFPPEGVTFTVELDTGESFDTSLASAGVNFYRFSSHRNMVRQWFDRHHLPAGAPIHIEVMQPMKRYRLSADRHEPRVPSADRQVERQIKLTSGSFNYAYLIVSESDKVFLAMTHKDRFLLTTHDGRNFNAWLDEMHTCIRVLPKREFIDWLNQHGFSQDDSVTLRRLGLEHFQITP